MNTFFLLSQVCPDYSGKPLGFDNCFTAFVVLIAGLVLGSILLFVEKSLIVSEIPICAIF